MYIALECMEFEGVCIRCVCNGGVYVSWECRQCGCGGVSSLEVCRECGISYIMEVYGIRVWGVSS